MSVVVHLEPTANNVLEEKKIMKNIVEHILREDPMEKLMIKNRAYNEKSRSLG